MSLHKVTATYRREIAALQRRIQALEKQVKVPAAAGGKDSNADKERFAAQRKKSGLSAAEYAKLLGVSALSVYKWENGTPGPGARSWRP